MSACVIFISIFYFSSGFFSEQSSAAACSRSEDSRNTSWHAVKRLLQALIIRVEPIGQACNVLPSGLELFLGLLKRAAHPDGRRRGTLARHALCLLCTAVSRQLHLIIARLLNGRCRPLCGLLRLPERSVLLTQLGKLGAKLRKLLLLPLRLLLPSGKLLLLLLQLLLLAGALLRQAAQLQLVLARRLLNDCTTSMRLKPCRELRKLSVVAAIAIPPILSRFGSFFSL